MQAHRVRVLAVCAAVLVAATALVGVSAQAVNAQTAPAVAEERVVYHVNDTGSARDALINVTNHLASSPQARITLLANGRGVNMLVQGEWDRHGEYASTIAGLQAKGVRFVACGTAMKKQSIEAKSLLPGVSVVPAGVVELTRLQTVEHYAYIKP
jgi:uncharacterized protein